MPKLIDLTGAKVIVPPGWLVSAGFGDFSIVGEYYDDYNMEYVSLSDIFLGYEMDNMGMVSSSANKIILEPGSKAFSNDKELGFDIIGGDDATNQDLIQWFIDNNATITGGVWEEDSTKTTYIRGDNVENATTYELYEKINDSYNLLASASEINFNLNELSFEEGDHVLVVKAKADGYEDSDYSNEVTYTVEAQEPEIVVPTDLTGYKVNVPAGWTASAGYGVFNLANSTLRDFPLVDVGIGYSVEMSQYLQTENYVGNASAETQYTPGVSLTFNIVGGTDVTNTNLIQWFVDNGATFEKVEETTKLINFTIDGTSYQAEDGMTWEQWVNSDYNTDGFSFNGAWNHNVYKEESDNNYYVYNTANNALVGKTGVEESSSNYELNIVSNGVYKTKTLDFSGGSN